MLKKVFKYLLIILLIGCIGISLFIAAVYYGVFGPLYTAEELKEFKNETATLVLSEEGSIIGKFYAENRINTTYEKLPKHLINALVATEDARYFEHEGVDSRSLLRVLFKTVLFNQRSAGGGSTIHQQLAKNMYGRERYGPLTMLVNKTKEGFLAHRLHGIYTKEEILTLYLNTVPFGENVLGIEAASRRYFNTSVNKLKIEEAAVLVGLLKANTYYNPRLYPENALRRRNTVLAQMEKYNYLSSQEKDSLSKLKLTLDYANLESEGPANYFLVQVKDEVKEILATINKEQGTDYSLDKSGLIVKTSLNLHMQRFALNAYTRHLGGMQKKLRSEYRTGDKKSQLNDLVSKEYSRLKPKQRSNARKNRELFSWSGFYTDSISVRDSIRHSQMLLHAGFLALDPTNGAIKVWVGGIDYRTQPYDQIFAQRQIASTFKPILYTAALEEGIQPCDYLDNERLVLTDFNDWQPQNYDKSYGGKYTMAAALSKSLNIPTVNLFLSTSFETTEALWERFGFSQELENKPSLALGTANASIYEVAIAYASFANQGFKIQPKSIVSIQTAEGKTLFRNRFASSDDRILEEGKVDLMNVMLQKTILEGTGRSLKSTYGIELPLAGKTGTSQDYADAWFAAYSPKLVMVTRVGASSPSIKFSSGANGSGSALALPLIARTLQQVQKTSWIKRSYSSNFKTMSEEEESVLLCEDYAEEGGFSKFLNSIFKKEETTLDRAKKRAERKAKRQKRKQQRRQKQ